MKRKNQIIGRLGEEIASKYLVNKGYKILEKNFSNKYGEIDIIALIDDTIVIVEVKTRKNQDYLSASQVVDKKKMKNIINSSKYYIDEYDLYEYNIRFDIIECYWKLQEIVHIENAFEV